MAFRIFMILLLAAQTGVLFAANAAVIGGEDTRELIGPNDTDHAAAVGMVYCEKAVMVNGEEKTFRKITTGTLVGNTQTLLATAHGFQAYKTDVRIRYQFDPMNDCQYRKYQAGGRYYGYSFVYAQSGGYESPDDDRNKDWIILQLNRKAIGQKAMVVRNLKQDVVDTSSRFFVEIIAHHHDKSSDVSLYHSDGYMRALELNNQKLFAHTADTEGRASGASIVYTDNKGVKAVYGIHTGDYEDHDLNRFIPINSKILEAIRDVMRHKIVSH